MTKRSKSYKGRRLYIDNMLSPAYAVIFKTVYGFNAIPIKTEFGKDAKDLDFLPRLGRIHPRPILFGCDMQMSNTTLELDALASTKLTYVLAHNNLVQERFEEQVWKVLRLWPKVMIQIDENPNRLFRVDFANAKIEPRSY